MICCVIGVFIICTAIEYIRKKTLDRITTKIVNSILSKIYGWFKRITG